MIKSVKKITGVFLSVLLVFLMVVPCAFAVTYPENVTKEKAEAAIYKTDAVINEAAALGNTTLNKLIAKEIYI